MNVDFHPKFARSFLDGVSSVTNALSRFDEEVKAGTFPSKEETYS
jgi:ketopantoate hydroxymethyltransferase